jgi:hypothetical protein
MRDADSDEHDAVGREGSSKRPGQELSIRPTSTALGQCTGQGEGSGHEDHECEQAHESALDTFAYELIGKVE